jgi:hypothetical protein
MGRRRNDAPKVEQVITKVDVRFADGPRQGDLITMGNPPPKWVKVAMPEWAVYELVSDQYRLKCSGQMALAWRNPEQRSII